MIEMLSELVPRAATKVGDALAVVDPKQSLTYSELNRKSAQLANALRDTGLAEGDRVAICMLPDVYTAVAVHGVFRSGGAFVPVDPDAPIERISSVLIDCGVRRIVGCQSVREKILAACAGLDGITVVGTKGTDEREVPWCRVWEWEDRLSESSMDPGRLAYIMYTSGSTGTPKGIAHTHASGLAYARNSAETYGLSPADSVSTTGPLHFDISTFSYLTAPLVGATTVIVPPAFSRMPASLAKYLEKNRVSVLYTVSSALTQFVERGALDKSDLSAMRWILFCGEPMAPTQLKKAMQVLPDVWFSNSYGPAEVNQCTYMHIQPGTDPAALTGQIPIGRAWAHTEIKLLDGIRETDPGEEGELVVSSPTMMSGYWNRPDLNDTAYYFSETGEKYYRTGDLARINPEGIISLIGRLDRQVKVRGYRVELDEIEVQLSAHPAVIEAAAFPVRTGDVVAKLGAAAIVASRSITTTKDLRHFLATRLPKYAIPDDLQIVSDFSPYV